MDYSRNYLFIDNKTQKLLEKQRILVCGVGIGSVFAEMALRTGFRNFLLADGDTVDASNLNRQNYDATNIGEGKAQSIASRLKSIDPDCQIQVIPRYLKDSDLQEFIPQSTIVINTIDFDRAEFLLCRKYCQQFGVPELFPINLGFGTGVAWLSPEGPNWQEVYQVEHHEELKASILKHLVGSGHLAPYLMDAASQYFGKQEASDLSYDPQLMVSAALSSALMISLIVEHVQGRTPEAFPNFHYLDAMHPVLIAG